jgi:hypothetical protein
LRYLPFVFDTKVGCVQAQLVQALSQRQAVATGDDHRLHVCALKHFQTMAIQCVKTFEDFTFTAYK